VGALDGIKVIDLSRLLPGAFCSTMLADHGADVTVVEAPRFRENQVIGVVPMVRRNKRHIALDLSVEAGREVFYKLVAQADALIEGFRPGIAKKLGLDYETICKVNPRVVYCSITGYGQDGPLRQKAGHDMNYMALAGILDLLRDEHGEPTQPSFQMANLSGSLYAVVGILLALFSRTVTGKGQYIDVSITDGLISLLAIPLSFVFSGSLIPGRPDNKSQETYACYRLYRTKDNRHIFVGPLEAHLWKILCEKLGKPEYAEKQFDSSSIPEVSGGLQEIFFRRDLKDWIEFLSGPDYCVSPLNRIEDLPSEPQLIERQMIQRNDQGVPVPGVAPRLSETPGSIRKDSYTFGGETIKILTELGYSKDSILKLKKEGVIWADDSATI
jgi:crotonobetainyl-CoA:carnitine CoA-transferase CaiB-like acyl-CoA transferase